jgi:membrane protein required for colicin V production
MTMNWADWVIILIVLISTVIGFKRGFVKELLFLLVLGGSFVVAKMFAPDFAEYLSQFAVKDVPVTPLAKEMASFSVLFIISVLLGSVCGYFLSSLVQVAGLSNSDRFLGAILGTARGVVIVLLAVLYVPIFFYIDQYEWWKSSTLIHEFLMMEDVFNEVMSSLYSFLFQTI